MQLLEFVYIYIVFDCNTYLRFIFKRYSQNGEAIF